MKTAGTVVNLAGRNKNLISEIASGDMQAAQKRVLRNAVEAAAKQKPKRKKKQKQPKTSTVTMSAAPVAYGSKTSIATPKQVNTASGSRLDLSVSVPTLLVKNADYGENGYATDPKLYRVYHYPMNVLKANLWRTMSERASQYKKYSMRSLRVTFVPTLPTTSSGNVTIVYYNDPNTNPPSDYGVARNVSGAVTASIYGQNVVLSLSSERLKYSPKDPRTVSPPGAWSPTGVLPIEEQATNRQSTQGVLYVCIESITTTAALTGDSEIANLVFNFDVDFFESAQNDLAYAPALYIQPSLNIDHTAGAALTINNAYWKLGSDGRSLYFLGGAQKFDMDITWEGPTGSLPTIPFSLSTMFGVAIIPSTFSTWTGTTVTPSVFDVFHSDFSFVATYGDHLTLDAGVLSAGSFSIEIIPVPGALTSSF